MELLERYLQEIKRHLPEDDANDVIAEISDDVQSQIETREAELQRPLDEREVAEIVKAYGHPRTVAARYRPQQYLIGPDLFPFWWYTVKIVFTTVLVLELIGTTIAMLVSPSPLQALSQAFPILWASLFWPFGVVTFGFAIIERFGGIEGGLAKTGFASWDPQTLPPVHGEEISRCKSLFEALVNIAFLLWLLDIPNVRHSVGFLLLGPGLQYVPPMSLTSSWHAFIGVAFAGSLAILGMNVALFLHPERTRWRSAVLVAANSLFVAATCTVLPVRELITLPGAPAGTLKILNEGAFYTVAAFGLIAALGVVLNLRALLRPPSVSPFNIAEAS